MSNRPKALVTGITGQDGAYLAELLLSKGYEVHGVKRRSSSFNSARIDHIYQDRHEPEASFFLHYGDLTDSTNVIRIVQDVKPDEVYNLGAQSHVKVSFDAPEYTANADGLGCLRILEAIRMLGLEKKTKFYQASTSELYGAAVEIPQSENTKFNPRSPYAVAKLYAFYTTVNYREAYNMFACNGILFNHESPIRGETFITRKITRAAARISEGLEDCLYLGNLDAKRDWGHAKEYVEGMWRMLQADKAEDYVLGTGVMTTVREFCQMAFTVLGMELEFTGVGVDEIGVCKKTGKTLVEVDPQYFRPTEVEVLQADATNAKENLGWEPKITVEKLCEEMVAADLFRAKNETVKVERGIIPAEVMAHREGSFLEWFSQNHAQT